ncbi:MAG: hypothetical protein JWO06_1963 [Bacteroidota bacterium]|nr:hypothetical protein [Bacteroidota bacterium]
MRSKLPFILLLIVLIYSCKTQKKVSEPVGPELLMDDMFRKPVSDKILFAGTNDLVPLDTVYIVKDTLHLITKKVVACDAENFKLIWNGTWTKTLPAQTNLKLFQAVEGSCKERHRVHLLYNISPLSFKQAADSTGTANLLIKVGGWKNELKYRYTPPKK